MATSLTSRDGLPSALGFTALMGLTGWIGGQASRQRSLRYRALRKPSFQPPDAAFPVVWTALYALIGASGRRAWRLPPGPVRRKALGLWLGQLAANGLWTWLFFGWKRRRLALADIGVILLLTRAYQRTIRPHDPTAARLMTPYVGWSAFAALLNAEIVRRNPQWL